MNSSISLFFWFALPWSVSVFHLIGILDHSNMPVQIIHFQIKSDCWHSQIDIYDVHDCLLFIDLGFLFVCFSFPLFLPLWLQYRGDTQLGAEAWSVMLSKSSQLLLLEMPSPHLSPYTCVVSSESPQSPCRFCFSIRIYFFFFLCISVWEVSNALFSSSLTLSLTHLGFWWTHWRHPSFLLHIFWS